MMEILVLFFVVFGVLLGILFLLYRLFSKDSVLKKMGYEGKYTIIKKKAQAKLMLRLGTVLPIITLAYVFLLRWIPREMKGIVFTALYILWLFPLLIIGQKESNKINKEMVMETHSEVVIDLNFKILHLMFKPWLEIAAALLCAIYNTLYLGHSVSVYMALSVLWFAYFLVRLSKNRNLSSFHSFYRRVFLVFILYQILLLGHFIHATIGALKSPREIGFIFALLLCIGLLVKLGYYLSNYPRFKRAISGE